MTQQTTLTFLPYYRRQFPVQIDSLSRSSRLSGTINFSLLGGKDADSLTQTTPIELPVTYNGPGDIEGINPSAIVRVEPPPGTPDFEPNYYPFIEFRDPDFLWRYSLDAEAGGNRQQPWLMLLALTSEELIELSSKKFGLTKEENGRWKLIIEKKYLPKAPQGQSRWDWASAHVQLNRFSSTGSGDVKQYIESYPDQNCCRLFCFRKLDPSTSYVLFLVPYYLAGAQEENRNTSVLDADQDPIPLPVYYHSSFATSEVGDFAYLASLLEPQAVPKSSGSTPVYASPGSSATISREGALAPPGYSSGRISYSTQIKDQQDTEAAAKELLLNFEIRKPETNLDEDPLVILPYYGKHYQMIKKETVQSWQTASSPIPWTIELNFDFRNRIPAGFGTAVVQKRQEEFLKQCWLQVGDLRLANEKLKQAQSALAISQSLDNRFLKKLSDERFVIATRPFHSSFAYQGSGKSVSLKKRLDASGLAHGTTQPAFLKICRQKIPNKRLDILKPWQRAPSRERPLRSIATALDRRLRPVLPISDFEYRAGKYGNLNLRKDIGQVPRLKKETIKVYPIEDVTVNPIKDFATIFRPKFDVAETLFTKVDELIDSKKQISKSFDPILMVPFISEPLYRPLKTLSLDYILPGIAELPMNSITLCEENRFFIEALMCGANDEMGKELLWNRFPADQRGTIFHYFWDPATNERQRDALGNLRPLRDIPDLASFSSTLGHNFPQTRNLRNFPQRRQEGRIVLLIKGDLIRRYPETVIFALNHDETIAPVFKAQLGVDILVVGFPFTQSEVRDKLYFVLQEQQELPRFGFATVAGQPPSPELYYTSFSVGDQANAAKVAKETFRTPTQLVIHSSHMIK